MTTSVETDRGTIRVSSLTKTYPGPTHGLKVLDDVSLAAERGSYIALRGVSGSGKSTTLRKAAKLACRIGVMHNGKLVQIGSPEEIKKQPENDYVQSLFSTADAPDAQRIIHQFLRLDKQGQEAVRRAVL